MSLFSVVSDEIVIRGRFFFPGSLEGRRPALIICHGIPGSVKARSEDDPGYEALAKEFASLGFIAVFFHFRGCGDSGGDFDMLGWSRDLERVIEKVSNVPQIDPKAIGLLGFSGGGAAAAYVAAHNPGIHSLAVVGTLATFRIFQADPQEVVQDFRNRGIIRDRDFPPEIHRWLESFEEIEPQQWISQFKGQRLLIVHGDRDELIPVDHARELFVRAPAGIAELVIIPGGEHRLRLDKHCTAKLKEWFAAKLCQA